MFKMDERDIKDVVDNMFKEILREVDVTEEHDCDNCVSKGNCPIEDTVREIKAKKEDKKSTDSGVFKFMKDSSKQKQNNKDSFESMKSMLDTIFFGGEVPKEVKEQTARIERIVTAKNQLNNNIEKLLFATTRFGKKTNGNPDFTHVESFAKHIEEMNRKMEDLIKHYESNEKKKRTKDDFRKDAEEMFHLMIKMIIETFNLGSNEEKAFTQVGLINNYNLYLSKNNIKYTYYSNIDKFKNHLTKYLHLESKAIKHLITSNEIGSSYLLESFRDVIIRTFIDTEYVEERDAE